MSHSLWARSSGLFVIALLSACASKTGAPGASADPGTTAPAAAVMSCQPQSQAALVGTWYATSTPRGVGGQFQALTVLRADGTMSYNTQLKIGKRMRPALRETGCWQADGSRLTLQTLRSGGDDVDHTDPIYLNRYRIEKVDANRMTLRDEAPGGQSVSAKKMPAGFKLPAR